MTSLYPNLDHDGLTAYARLAASLSHAQGEALALLYGKQLPARPFAPKRPTSRTWAALATQGLITSAEPRDRRLTPHGESACLAYVDLLGAEQCAVCGIALVLGGEHKVEPHRGDYAMPARCANRWHRDGRWRQPCPECPPAREGEQGRVMALHDYRVTT